MIACDTSVLIDYLAGASHRGAARLDLELKNQNVALPPVVVTEVLSDPTAGAELVRTVGAIPLLEASPGYWQRAGALRAKLTAHKVRTPLADALICQSCLDHGVPLLTRDRDFRNFALYAGLKLI